MMWCSVGFAQTTVTFVAGTDKSNTTTLTKDGVTLNINNGTFSNGTDYRSYKNATQFTVSSAKGKITKIELTCTGSGAEEYGPGILTGANVGEYTYKGTIGTWIGNAQSVTINKKKTAQVRMKKIVVTLEAEKTKTTLTFPEQTISINGGDEASFKGQPAKLYAGEQELTDKTIKYAHTGDEIFATFDETTGAATLKSGVYGTATVTATYAGDDTYEEAVASYTVKIVDPNDTRIIFDQYNEDHPAFENLGSSYSDNPGTVDFVDIHGNNYAFTINSGACKQKSCQIGKGETISSPIFNLANGYTVRVYYTTSATSKTLLLSVAEDKVYGVKYDNESWVATLSTTKDEAFSLTANSLRVCKVTKIEITPAVVLDENATKEETSKFLEKNINKTIDIVTLTRTLVANKWNTFCVPFETEIAGTALEGATVKTVGTIESNVINLVDADKIEAGVPYLVMPTTGDIVNPTFKSVTISVTKPVEKGNDEYKFVGTYSTKTIKDQEFGKIWGVTAEGKLAKIKADTTMKGLRAYFVFPTNTPAAKLNFDGETTGINNIETNATVNGKVYNLNGQYVGNSLNGLKKGIYVVNGKKVIK